MSVRKVVGKKVQAKNSPKPWYLKNLEKVDPKKAKANQFKKGQSGNPNGRPKILPALDLLIAEALGIEPGGDYRKSGAMKIINKMKELAAKGHVRAAEIVMDRGWGRVQQTLDVTTAGKEIGPGVTQIFNNAPPLAGDEKDIKP